MKTLEDLVHNIEYETSLFLDKRSIHCLKAFIDGWSVTFEDSYKLVHFQKYIEKLYKLERSHSWAAILSFIARDECEALQLFFIEFKKIQSYSLEHIEVENVYNDSFIEMLQKIKKRPAMYISKNSIYCLKAFLDGFMLSRPNDIESKILMKEFEIYIGKSNNLLAYSKSWAKMIDFYSGDEFLALEHFFKWFSEFQEQRCV